MGKAQQADMKKTNDTLMNGRQLSENEANTTILHVPGSREEMQLLTYLAPATELLPPSSCMDLADDDRVFDDEEQDVFTSSTRVADPPQSISLFIELTRHTFFDIGEGMCNGKDVSFEVYLNGELVQADMITCRSLARTGYTVLLSGTRIHRQIEKPWVYEVSNARLNTTQAKKRLHAIGTELAERAADKTNVNGRQTLSGKFLSELAHQPLPGIVQQDGKAYSVLDIVVVAGRGHKLGPETPYLKMPAFSSDFHQSDLQRHPKNTAKSSADEHPISPSPTTKLTTRLNRSLGFSHQSKGDLEASNVPPRQENCSNHTQVEKTSPWEAYPRTSQTLINNLDPRLTGDDVSIDAVLSHAGSWVERDAIVAIDAQLAYNDHEMKPRPQQPEPASLAEHIYESTDLHEYDLERFFDVELTPWYALGQVQPQDCEIEATGTSNEQLLQPSVYTSDLTPFAEGVYSSLKRRRASSSPTPVKDLSGRSSHMRSPPALRRLEARELCLRSPTQTSSMASTQEIEAEMHDASLRLSVHGPVTPKSTTSLTEPNGHAKFVQTSCYATPAPSDAQSTYGGITSPQTPRKAAPQTPRRVNAALTTPSRPGSHRTNKKWDPYEMSTDEALASFRAPALTRVGAIRYADPGARRQVPKVRGIQFLEEVFLCGIRYFVE